MARPARQFEILFEPDVDGYHVWCPVLRGCHSFGMTRSEARVNIVEAIQLWLDDADTRRDDPLDSEQIEVFVASDEPRS